MGLTYRPAGLHRLSRSGTTTLCRSQLYSPPSGAMNSATGQAQCKKCAWREVWGGRGEEGGKWMSKSWRQRRGLLMTGRETGGQAVRRGGGRGRGRQFAAPPLHSLLHRLAFHCVLFLSGLQYCPLPSSLFTNLPCAFPIPIPIRTLVSFVF
jgi:hypothetical protein